MAFPELMVELKIGGVWVDVTTDAMREAGVSYQWGRRSEGQVTDPATAVFELFNPDGKFNNRNPLSPYFGQLGRNTPVRITHGGVDVALVCIPDDHVRASTPDNAALDITGDIDIRVELTPVTWGAKTTDNGWEVVAKYVPTGDQRSWAIDMVGSGNPRFYWSPDGTLANLQFFLCPVAVPFGFGDRGAIRATLDVDNGLGGYTATIYWSDSISGSWTVLGQTVTTAGTTSIFNSTAPLEVGDVSTLAQDDLSREYHKFELRSGIAGSVVANPDFTAQASGTTVFVDGAGRTWTVPAGAITSRRIRMMGEASSWEPKWTSGGRDVMTPVESSGILRRLGQGTKPLQSTLRRRLPTRGPVAYWPMEDDAEATVLSTPIAGAPTMTLTDATLASDATCPGSDPLPAIGDSSVMIGFVPPHASPTNGYLAAMVYAIAAAPASSSRFFAFTTTGTANEVVLQITATQIVADLYNDAGGLITSQAFANGQTFGPGKWFRLDVSAQQNGGNVDFHLGFVDVDNIGVNWNFSIAGTVGIIEAIGTAFGPLLDGMRLGHVAVFPSSDLSVWGDADNGYRGERASERLFRLASEESIPIAVAGDLAKSMRMGPQRSNQIMSLLRQCEDSDMGILGESRDRIGLYYRNRHTLYDQTPALTIPYSQLVTPLEPVDDDRYIRNDITVERISGSEAHATELTGPLSVNQHPNGVGIYDHSRTLSVQLDSFLPDIANWLLHLGTVDEARYPSVRILLHKYPSLVPAVCRIKQGDIIRITDLPSFLPPGPVDLMVEGGSEEITSLEWTVTFICSPGSPWSVLQTDSDTFGKLETTGSTLDVAVDGDDTTLVVHTTQDDLDRTLPLWTQDGAEYPFNLKLGGEVVTATACTSLLSDDFNRTVAAGSWGTASDGHTYTLTGGTNSERSVASNRGVVTITASQASLRFQTVAETARDVDMVCTMSVSQVATGASEGSNLIFRFSNSTDFYRLRLHWTTTNTTLLSVLRGSTQEGGTVTTPYTYAAGDTFKLRVRVVGHRVLGKAWPTTVPEPVGWQIDRTISASTIASGQVGVACGGLGGNTNTGEYRFDDLLVSNPQRFTVTRSANGIVKSHAVGTAVTLETPATIAL